MTADSRLYRSATDRYLGGICGGLGEYLGVDPTVVRLIVVVLALVTNGVVLAAYFIAWFIVPVPPPGYDPVRVRYSSGGWRRYLPGLLLIALGVLLLVHWHVFWLGWDELWPLLLIMIGLVLILRGTSRRNEPDHTPSGDQQSDTDSGGPRT